MEEVKQNLELVDQSKRTFGPLSFEEINFEKCTLNLQQECLLCNLKFSIQTETGSFLKHSFEEHKLIIEDFQNISRMDKYVTFWKNKFVEQPMESIVPSVQIEGTNNLFFVLSSLLKDDKQIRHELKLETVLEQQEHERVSTDFKRNCLFCKLEFEGKAIDFIKHLSGQHNLQLGKPENLVFVTELLNCIEEKINSLKCIYCEKTFPDRNTLKEHMRKKLHKQINPSNKFYDKFYIVNYLEVDKNWADLQKEDDNLPITLDGNNSDQEWSDWKENDQEIVCLFCDYKDLILNKLCEHMISVHDFKFQTILSELEYYHRVKLINYIRRQLHINNCVKCDENFTTKQLLYDHMNKEKHCIIPDIKVFDQPEYYFPTYENDTLLCYLDEINDNDLV